MINALEFVIYWSIVLLPFSVAISTGLSNTVLGFLGFAFIVKKIVKRERLFINTPLNIPFLLLMIVALFSIKNTINFSDSFHGIIKLVKSGLLLLICAEEIRGIKHIKRIVFSTIFSICLVSIDGLWQLRSGWDFVRGQLVASSPIALARPTSSLNNPNAMGIYLGIMAPLIIGLTLYYYKGKEMLFYGIVSLLASVGIYITFSRGSGLGLFFSVLFLAVMRRHKVMISVLLAALLIFPFIMPKNIKTWAKEINYNPAVLLFNKDRITMYANTVNMISNHPFIGVGVNTYSRNYGKYKIAKWENYAQTTDTSYAQSNYFQMAGETGLISLAIFLWLLYLLFRELIRYYSKAEDEYLKVISLSLIACFIAFLINGLTESSLYYSRVAVLFWYFAGVSLSLNKLVYAKNN